MPGAFFFMNLFLHIVLPIGVGIILWLHVSRIARPALMPPRGLTWTATGVLVFFSVVWPIGMSEEATAFRLPGTMELSVGPSSELGASVVVAQLTNPNPEAWLSAVTIR